MRIFVSAIAVRRARCSGLRRQPPWTRMARRRWNLSRTVEFRTQPVLHPRISIICASSPQLNRNCQTNDQWVQGYNDYQALCGSAGGVDFVCPPWGR